jgi:2,3-bisphosphoglycerate-independent phosphoglycerate mutase
MAIFCIIDGMTDQDAFSFEPYSNLNIMRQKGGYGYFRTTPQGMNADTMPCTLTLLGLPRARLPVNARTYFEAVGCDIPVKHTDLLMRCNLVKLNEDGRLVSSCADGVTAEQAQEMAADLPGLPVKNIGGYKNILVIPNAAGQIDSVITYPPHQSVGMLLKDRMPVGAGLPELVRNSFERLSPYLLWPWAPSVFTQLPKINEKAAAVCGTQIIKGISRAAGFTVPNFRNATGDTDTDLIEKAETVLALSRNYPLVFLHINGADEAAHRLNGGEKEAFLHRIDMLVMPRLAKAGKPVLITSDHGCSPATGAHLANPQPFILYGASKTGDLGILEGSSALTLLTGRQDVLWPVR